MTSVAFSFSTALLICQSENMSTLVQLQNSSAICSPRYVIVGVGLTRNKIITTI